VPHVLIVDDRLEVRRSTAPHLRRDGHVVHEAATVPDALAILRMNPCRVVVAVVAAGRDVEGGEFVAAIKAEWPRTAVVVAGCGGVAGAVRAMRAGACNYAALPVDPIELARMVHEHIDGAVETRAGAPSRAHAADAGGGEPDVVMADAAIRRLFAKADRLAAVDCAVLLTGESGTGKEVLARRIFHRSRRHAGPFVAINCAAIPDGLVESELFGHRRGAFTGAGAEKPGLIEAAESGVLFLDEIGEMPAHVQVALLRFLDSHELRRVGDTVARRVDVRIIAATNRRLEHEVRAEHFRLDLFYRLCVVSLAVPPLRERPADIPALAEHFLARHAAKYGKAVADFSASAMEHLTRWRWPGNIRELQNVIESAVVLAAGHTVTIDDLPPHIVEGGMGGATSTSAAVPAADQQMAQLLAAFERCGGNQTHTAAALGISRTTLWRRLRRMQAASDGANLVAVDGNAEVWRPAVGS
jgi:DNA-binding NtrC family response regulator